MNYYNEFDKDAAQWLRNLITAGLIPRGDVDQRSITEVQPHELDGYTQCHFFAGIGGWPRALRLAGWPDDRPVWTGSAPCQPFSVAGKRGGTADARHLWPEFLRLIRERRPARVFGEQVASKAGRAWLAGVRGDLEALAYAVGGADLCAAGIGAPHIRQRLYWMADADMQRRDGIDALRREGWCAGVSEASGGGETGGMAHGDGFAGGQRGALDSGRDQRSDAESRAGLGSGGDDCGLPDASGARLPIPEQPEQPGSTQRGQQTRAATAELCGVSGGRVSDANGGGGGIANREERQHDRQATGRIEGDSLAANDRGSFAGWGGHWIACADGKARRIEPGLSPLAHGIPGRVVRLRGYGNAIVPHLAAEFIMAADECIARPAANDNGAG